MLECVDRDDYLHLVYNSIVEMLFIENPPTVSFDDSLEKIGLNGLYNNNTNNIKISSSLFDNNNENQIKITIVHELSHFLLYKEHYAHGAHGWPFLVVCVLLSIRAGFNGDYILSSNIGNWRNGTNVKRWLYHFFTARDLILSIISDEANENMGAHSLTTKIMTHKPGTLTLIPESLVQKTHKYFARTDGDIFLLRDSGIFFMGLSVAFMEIHLFTAFRVSLTTGFSYFILSKTFIKYNPAYKRTRFEFGKMLNSVSHLLIYLPWNQR